MPTYLGKVTKQPNETLDYYVSFDEWFVGRSDAAVDYEVEVQTGLTLDDDSRVDNTVRIVLSGGTDSNQYKVTVRMITNATPPIIREGDFIVKVRES